MSGEQLTLDGGGLPLEQAQKVVRSNPLIPVYGKGPAAYRCGDCVHLFRVGGIASHVLKCDLRRRTSGAATDHRAKWPTCGRFELNR